MGTGVLSGTDNTGVGNRTLLSLTTGGLNSALGCLALDALTTGSNNVGVGCGALGNLVSGDGNVALGTNAGSMLTNGSNNFYISHPGGAASESNQGYIGNSSTQRLRLISLELAVDALANLGPPLPVLAGLDGLLALGVSSARAKDDVRDMGDVSRDLMKLRPVTFHYRPGQGGGAEGIQYGLIAEEVAEVYPQLVATDKSGQPSNVAYHLLPAMLLNELQRQHRHIDAQEAKLAAQQQEIEELRARLLRLEDGKVIARHPER